MSRIVAAVALCAFVGLLSVPHVAAAGEKAGDVVSRFQEAYRSGSVDQMLDISGLTAFGECNPLTNKDISSRLASVKRPICSPSCSPRRDLRPE
jgi:hypothetical protein